MEDEIMAVSVKDWRLRVGLTQRELAGLLGITERQVIRLEAGHCPTTRMHELALQALDAEHNRRAAVRRASRG